jgi:predicted metal-dependent peptidase
MAVKEAHVIALDRAKIALMTRKDSAFFVSLCFSMKHKWDLTIPTACTNGKEIRYSPIFFMGCSPEERIFLLLHETLHVAYEHMGRLMGRDMLIWNFACDHVINLQLIARGYKMPKNGLADSRFQSMSAEKVYNILMQEHQAAGCPAPGQGELDLQDLQPLPEGTDPVKHAQEIKEILVRAVMRSKQESDAAGVIPGDIEIMLEKLLNPKLPWQTILRRWLQSFNKSDYSWTKPNRRFFPEWFLPSLHSTRLINLTVAIDTSGSVSDEDFLVMVSEVAGVFRLAKPELITLIQFDTQIKSITKIRSLRDLKNCKFTGRGGTNVTPVIEWANKHKPQLLLWFTDGGFSTPKTTYPSSQTVWLIHNNPHFEAEFGKVVHYEMPS